MHRLITLPFLLLVLVTIGRAQDVKPLLNTQWDQGSPYNSLFPKDAIGKAPQAGCIPVAMAQVIFYLDNSYDSLQLIYDCAKSVPTTFFDSYTSSRGAFIIPAMKRLYHFSKYMNSVFQSDYYGEDGQKAWGELIFNELRHGRPVLAKGENRGRGGGHLFILDGVKDTLVHVNFGWGGKGNGYYPLSDLRNYSFNMYVFVDIGKDDYVPTIDTLRVKHEGELKGMLATRNKWSMRHLRIEGSVNVDDINALHELARFNSATGKTPPLRTLDLSATHISALPDSAFADCQGLVFVSLPEGLEDTGHCTFMHCKMLNTVKLPSSLKVIGGRAFFGCPNLLDVNTPNGMTSIQTLAFGYCGMLENFQLPPTLKSIGPRAFKNCESLLSLHLPTSLRFFAPGVLDGCTHVKVSIDSTNPYFFVKDNQICPKK